MVREMMVGIGVGLSSAAVRLSYTKAKGGRLGTDTTGMVMLGDAVNNAVRRLVERFPRQMCIARRCLRSYAAEQSCDHQMA